MLLFRGPKQDTDPPQLFPLKAEREKDDRMKDQPTNHFEAFLRVLKAFDVG